MLKRALALAVCILLVCAVAAPLTVQASDTSPPLVAVLLAQMGIYESESKQTGDPWTEPCVPSCRADLSGGGIGYLGGGFSTSRAATAYPLLE